MHLQYRERSLSLKQFETPSHDSSSAQLTPKNNFRDKNYSVIGGVQKRLNLCQNEFEMTDAVHSCDIVWQNQKDWYYRERSWGIPHNQKFTAMLVICPYT